MRPPELSGAWQRQNLDNRIIIFSAGAALGGRTSHTNPEVYYYDVKRLPNLTHKLHSTHSQHVYATHSYALATCVRDTFIRTHFTALVIARQRVEQIVEELWGVLLADLKKNTIIFVILSTNSFGLEVIGDWERSSDRSVNLLNSHLTTSDVCLRNAGTLH